MFIKTFFKPVLFAIAASVSIGLYAQTVVKVGYGDSTKNPSIFLKGISGSPGVNSIVAGDLKNCGWFDVTGSANADYVVYGAYSQSRLIMNVRNSLGKLVCTVKSPVYAKTERHDVHKGVDVILKKLFNIPGICATRIAFSVKTTKKSKNIYICDYDGKNIRQITRHTSLCVEPEWFPDGRSILYTMYGKSATNIIQTVINPLKSRLLVRMKGLNTGGTISPNGRYMALIMSRDKQVELYVKEVNSRKMRRLTVSKAVEASPCWSPDGNKIYFVSDLYGRQNLFVISANGGRPVKIKTVGVEATSPDCSRDGSIVYSARMGRNYALAVISKDSRVKSGILVSAAGDWESPSWAPDGRHVICSRKLNGMSSLYIVDTWSKKAKKLIGGKYDMTFPAWSNPY